MSKSNESGTSMNGIPAAQSDARYVDYAYQTALGRSADAEGKAYWLDELQSGHIDRATLLSALAFV